MEKLNREDFLANRARYLAFVFVALFSVISLGYWYHQIWWGDYYQELSQRNCIKKMRLLASRGRIFDRRGKLLVGNRPCFNLWLNGCMSYKRRKAVLQHACNLFGKNYNDVVKRMNEPKNRIYGHYRLAFPDISQRNHALYQSHKYELKGLELYEEECREYPHGSLLCHLLGYTSEINADDLAKDLYKKCYVRQGDYIGKSGLERLYDKYLIGTHGEHYVERDANGRIVRILDSWKGRPVVNGYDVHTTLDLRLTQIIERVFDVKAGAVVAVEPNTGQLRALVSRPAFDPNIFIGGMNDAEWATIADKNIAKYKPLYNRALQSFLPPGSIFKIVTASAGLKNGIISTKTRFSCPGFYYFSGRPYGCWKEEGHGSLSVVQALKNSCNVFFFNVGHEVEITRLAEMAHEYGLGERTDFELYGWKKGLMPDKEWKQRTFKKDPKWHPGETLSVAIGQGAIKVSPLQVSMLMATVANGGKRMKPYCVNHLHHPETKKRKQLAQPEVIHKLSCSQYIISKIQEGLRLVVKEGTAHRADVKGLPLYGKTGTVQVAKKENIEDEDEIPEHLQDHSWFASGCEMDGDELVLVVFIQNGGKEGAKQRLEFAKEIYKQYYSGYLMARK